MVFQKHSASAERKRMPLFPVLAGLVFFASLGAVVFFFKQAALQTETEIVSAKQRSIDASPPPAQTAVTEAPVPPKTESVSGSSKSSGDAESEAAQEPPPPANSKSDTNAALSAAPQLLDKTSPPPVERFLQEALPAPSLRDQALQTIASYSAYSLQEISRIMRERYGNLRPRLWGEAFEGITSRLHEAVKEEGRAPVLALTFDACGGKKGDGFDERIIAFLRESRISATLFITTRWAQKNPEAFKDLAADPLFEIAAHGRRHRPCSVNGKSVYGIKGTASIGELIEESEGCARDLAAAAGMHPLWFRSGTAYYDDAAVAVIRDLGMHIAGYSIAADEGATLSAAAVAAKTLSAEDGDILLFHMNRPGSGTYKGILNALPQLQKRGCIFVKLSSTLSK